MIICIISIFKASVIKTVLLHRRKKIGTVALAARSWSYARRCWAPEGITKTTNQKLWDEHQNCLHLSKAASLNSIKKAGHAETSQPSLAAARLPWTTSLGALKLTGRRSQEADRRNSPSEWRMPSYDPPNEALAFPVNKLLPKMASMSAGTPSPDASRPRASVEESACADPAFSNVSGWCAWSLPGTASCGKTSGARSCFRTRRNSIWMERTASSITRPIWLMKASECAERSGLLCRTLPHSRRQVLQEIFWRARNCAFGLASL